MNAKAAASLTILAAATFFRPVLAPAAPQVFDLNADWGEVSNPNGVWTYRAGSALLAFDAPPITNPLNVPAWVGPDGYLPVFFKYTGADYFDMHTGDVVVHSANSDSEGVFNVLWTAPSAGTINVSGAAWFAAEDGFQNFRSSVWSLWLRGTLLTGGEVSYGDAYDRSSPFQFSAGSGGAGVLQNVPVAAGDQLMLQVRKETGAFGTVVGLNWTIGLTSGSQCVEPPSGILSWWRGEGDALDSVGTHHGTLQNGTAFAPGKVGQAFHFDGADDYVDLGSWFNLQTFSIAMWVKAGVVQQTHADIIDNNHTDFRSWALQYQNTGLRFGWGIAQRGGVLFDLTADTWQFLVMTFDSAYVGRVYLDGSMVGSFTGGGPPIYDGTEFLRLSRWGGGGRHFNGQIDECDIYTRALTAAEVQAIHSAGAAGKCVTAPTCAPLPAGAVGWWRAENNALDSVGPNHGTLQNGAAFAAGKVGQAFSLNGANQYVLIGEPVPPSLQIQNEITLSAWIYVSAYPGSGTLGLIIGSQYDVSQSGATIFLDGRTSPDGQPAPPGHIHFQIGDGSWHTANANAQVPLNQWVHIAATRKANEGSKIYYNGVLQPSTSVPWSGAISYTGAWFAIGQQKDINRPFNGLIDEADIYSRALSATEIQSLYVAGSAGKCVPSQCVPPVITTAPLSQSLCPGANAALTVSASGTAPLSYQWSKDGTDLSGATSASLTINPVSTASAGSYRVRVSNACGQIESASANLTVSDAAPVITLNGPSPLYLEACTGTYFDPGASANDDCDGAIPVTMGGDTVNTAQPGTYFVSYAAMDSGGHAVTALRTVVVQDTVRPVFTTVPAPLTLSCGSDNAATIDAWLAGAAAEDACGVASITHTIAWSGPCAASSALVTWTATDSHGLTASATAALTLLPDRLLTGVQFDVASLQLTLPANTVQQAMVPVRNSGGCPTIVQSAQIAASFQSPGLTVLTPLPVALCAGASTSLAIQVDTTAALEGVYAGTLIVLGADGGSLSLPIEIVVSGRLLPDLSANYTGGGVSFQPESSPLFPVTDEPFTISAAVKNVGTAPAGAFTVKFLEGTSLLGTAEVAGLGIGQSTTATLDIPAGFPVDGFYLIRAEVVPPAGGELRLVNNSGSALLQIGMPFTGTAFIRVTASLTPDCSLNSGTLGVHAEYVIVTEQATLTFPVQGGRVDAVIQGTPFTITGAHTDVGGNLSTGIGLPAGGNYTVEVTVTDFTLTETETFPVTVPSVPNCPQGGQPDQPGNPAPYVPPGESADLYLCSSDVSFRTGDGSMTLSAPPTAGQSIQICAIVNYYTSLGRELNSQPVHFTARRQTSDSVEEYFIGTALANFAGGGSTTVCVPWTVPDEGTFIVSVSLAPAITQFEANDLATRALVSGNPASPVTAIHVTAEGGGCSPIYQWVNGRATYERPGAPLLPVVCGQITVRAYDESGTLLATVGGFSTDSAGNFGFNPRIPLPFGINRLVVDVTDGTLTGSNEFTIQCEPSPNVPAPDAPPAPEGDLYVFSEHIAFLASDCLNSWNRNPLPGETISVAADIHYFDNYLGTSLNAVPVDINVLVPIGDALQSLNIAHSTVDFPFGGGSSIICVPWTPLVPGPQIVQVVINPESLPLIPLEYMGNNAATRLIFVGNLDVVLTADPRELRIHPGDSASFALHGETLNNAHPTLSLAAYFEGPGTAPAGLTASLGASSITVSGDTTLTLATTAATPPGSYRYYVVGSGDGVSAIARLTLIVEPSETTPLEIACPADIVTLTDPGQCSAAVTFTAAASGGCQAPVVVCSPPSGSSFARGTTAVTCTATDTCGNSATCQFHVTVNNPPPTVTINGPASGAIYAVGTTVSFSGTYSDNTGDTHTGGFMADTQAIPTTLSGGNATATYVFTTPGVYLIKLTVTDACGQSATSTSIGDDTAMVVVYDPNAGFVTGGGWIHSPAGAYLTNPGLSGKATFGFVSKYKKGANLPTGETEFQFHAGGLNFHSIAYDWLVVSGAKAQYKGTGTINGSGSYKFLLTVTDGQVTGGGGVDKFRLKITDGNSVIYDNVPGAGDDLNSANPQVIGSGSIVIHQ